MFIRASTKEKNWKSWLPTFRFWKSQANFWEVPIFHALIIRVQVPVLNHITKRKWKCVLLFQLRFVDTTTLVDLYNYRVFVSILLFLNLLQHSTVINNNFICSELKFEHNASKLESQPVINRALKHVNISVLSKRFLPEKHPMQT